MVATGPDELGIYGKEEAVHSQVVGQIVDVGDK